MTTETVFITKYALSSGIIQVANAEVDGNMVSWRNPDGWPQYAHSEGKDWHRSMDAARLRAMEMRNKKIKSLEQQIKKLGGLSFPAAARSVENEHR